MVTIPTTNETRQAIITKIEGQLGQTVPIVQKAFVRVLAAALAGPVTLLYRYAQWARKQIFVSTADESALVERGESVDVIRTPAVAAVLTATATGTDTTIVSAGTLWRGKKNSVVYEQSASIEITSGTATITVEALTAGDVSNLSNGDTLEILAPLAGVDDEATVASTTTNGEDAEALEDYRNRVARRIKNPPQGGAIPDWIKWAGEVAGIAEAKIDRPSPGVVNIYPLTDDADPANRIPGSTKLTEVEDYVTDQRRSPIRAASVSVIAPAELTFDVEIADIDPNNPDTKSAIESAIESYLYSRRPKQYTDESNTKEVVSASDITGVARDAGAKVATITLKNSGGSTITSYTLQIHELAVLGSVTWI